MNVRIFWVRAMKCMCAQTRPRFILSSERVFGGMEFEPMLTPREKSPLPENFPRGGSNPRLCGQRAQTLPASYSGPRIMCLSESVFVCVCIDMCLHKSVCPCQHFFFFVTTKANHLYICLPLPRPYFHSLNTLVKYVGNTLHESVSIADQNADHHQPTFLTRGLPSEAHCAMVMPTPSSMLLAWSLCSVPLYTNVPRAKTAAALTYRIDKHDLRSPALSIRNIIC